MLRHGRGAQSTGEHKPELDSERRTYLELHIEEASLMIGNYLGHAKSQEIMYGGYLGSYTKDGRLCRLAVINKWPETRIHLPTPEEVEQLLRKRQHYEEKYKAAKVARQSTEDKTAS